MPAPLRTQRRIVALERQRMALELRKAGLTYAQIAEQIGYKHFQSAYYAVQAALKEIIHEPVLELRTVQMERLNYALVKIWPGVQAGNRADIETMLRIMDKIDRLQGTEVPQQMEVHHEGAVLVINGSTDDYVQGLEEMAKRVGAIDVQELPTPTVTEGQELGSGDVVGTPSLDPTNLVPQPSSADATALPEGNRNGGVNLQCKAGASEAAEPLTAQELPGEVRTTEPCPRYVRPHDDHRRELGLCARCDNPKDTHV